MRQRKFTYLVADFETTVFKGQEYTEVWSAACVELYKENVAVYHSIDELFDSLITVKGNVIVYFHNLKFDGSFWLPFLMSKLKYSQAFERLDPSNPFSVKWLNDSEMPNKSFKYSISDRGQWYTITIKASNKIIEIRDSLKLLPFSLARIGQDFGTRHKKLEMVYEGYRFSGCEITEEELEYIKADVLVLKEALEIMFEEGHDKLTIGSCCLSEYKKSIDAYEMMFPNVYDVPLPESMGYSNAGEYIRKSYKGGWCYVVKEKVGKVLHDGVTADVNSLYPSMMHSSSGNMYPTGQPVFWEGKPPISADKPGVYYFIRVKTRFYLKKGFLPFIQIKSSYLYDGTECLESSDIYDAVSQQYYSSYIGQDGELADTRVELTLTMTDYKLFQEHYNLVDFEILDGCWFDAEAGIFDAYIDKYKKQKIESKGARKELAKLFLNNLYGKMASSTDSSFKVAFLKDNGIISFGYCDEHDKKPGYIPVGAAITSYSRCFTIRAAQKNYHGKENGFAYADTDSIHCDLPADKLVGVTIDENEFSCWKLEANWDEAFFTRQKTYIERLTHKNMKTCEPFYSVKCAGMPDKCKELFVSSMEQLSWPIWATDEHQKFLSVKRRIQDFDIGLTVPGKLTPKRVKGGIILSDTTYQMR